MRAEVARFNPSDVEGYERFMRESEAIYRVGFERLGDVPFSSPLDMARIAGDLVAAAAAIAASTGSFRNISATSGCGPSSAFIRCLSAAIRSAPARSIA